MARNILITGGNSGIGKEMARALAADGDRVIIASSDLDKSRHVADEISPEDGKPPVEAMQLDLADGAAIDRFAADLLERMPVIDVLILNAGLYTHGPRTLPNGLETMIGIMHFGHFRLVQRLRAAVVAAPQGRIVVTSSQAHRIGRIKPKSFEDPSARTISLQGYAQAKLANILFTRELARALADTPVTVNTFHPGSVATGIWQELPYTLQRFFGSFLVDCVTGADTALWLARSAEARQYNGEYFYKRKPAKISKAAKDDTLAAWLWQDSEDRMPGF